MTAKKVLILGYGEMGHAMEYLLKDKHRVAIWEKYPQGGFLSAGLEKTVPEVDLILFCLPVTPHRQVAERIASLIPRNCICLSIAKGLDEEGQTAAEVFADVFSDQTAYVLLYGPMISEEIRVGRYAFGQVGVTQDAHFKPVQELFDGTRLFVKRSDDITGISWSVILKNVYALAFGMADELQLGDNTRGFLASQALQELDRIVQIKGGKQSSPFHLAGLGDLITTATSKDSHHHQLGTMLARGERENISGEGIHTLEMVRKHQLLETSRFPLFSLIAQLVDNPDNVQQHFDNFLHSYFHP